MKIAIITTDNREHLKDYGRPQPYFGTAPEALIQGFALLPEVEVHVVSCVRQPVESPEKIAPNVYYHPVLVPKIGWMSTLYQGTIRAVRRKLAEIGPDIVHGQGTERDCAMNAVFSGFPNVVTIHGNMAELYRRFATSARLYHRQAAWLETLALKKTAGVFCNSAYTESLVAPRSAKTWRVANAIRQDFFTASASSPGRLFPEPTLLNVGVVSPRKQQVELLAVARRLHEEGTQVRFAFVGSVPAGDPYGSRFLAEIARAEKKGYACYLGLRATAELIDLFDSVDALLHFPLEEAFGLVVAEGVARNLKLFASAEGGIVDIAAGVDGAELYAVSDREGLRHGIERWIREGGGRPADAAGAMERFHPRVIASRHLEIYREVLTGSGR